MSGQGRPWRASKFEAAFAVVLLFGLPLAFGMPRTLDGKFYALIAVFFCALGAGAGAALWLRRPEQSFEERIAAHFDLALPGARPAPDTGRWSLELLGRLEPQRFDELCAAYFDAAGRPLRAARFAGKVQRVGINAVRELREGAYVTCGRFSEEVIAYARKNRIELIDGAALLEAIAALAPEQRDALLKLATREDLPAADRA